MIDPERRRRPWAAFAAMCAVFGTTFLAIRVGVREGAAPLPFAGLRFVTAGGLLLGGCLARGRGAAWREARRLAPRAALVGLPLTAVTFGAMYCAERRIDSGLMSRLDALGPVATALLAWGLLGARPGRRGWAGLGLGLAGGVLLAGTQAGRADAIGLALALLSVVAYAAGLVLCDRLLGPGDDALLFGALQSLAGGAVLLAAAPLLGPMAWPRTGAAWLALAYLTLAGSLLGHTLSLLIVRAAGAVFASSWLYVSPPIATALGAVVLGERLGALEVVGTGLALAGVYLLGRPPDATSGSAALPARPGADAV